MRDISQFSQKKLSWVQEAQRNEEKAVYPLFINPEDQNGTSGIALQPQAIRTFIIRYNQKANNSTIKTEKAAPKVIEIVPEKKSVAKNEE